MLALLYRFRGFLSLLLTVFLSVWLAGRDINQRAAVAHGIQVTLLSPVQYMLNKANTFRNVMTENRRLLSENVQIKTENAMLRETARENIRLRDMLGYRAVSPFQLIPAEVVAQKRDVLSNNLILAAGSRHGVRKDQPVITLEGAVGKVIEVYPFHSNVQLISDANARTGALFARLNVPGILESENGLTAAMKVFLHHDVRPGDTVVTSGLGGIFPKGLYLGRVIRVTPGNNLYKTAEIQFHPGLNNIEYTFVLNIEPQWKAFTEQAADTVKPEAKP